METLQIILSSGVGAGVMAIILAALQRHWRNKDGRDEDIKALMSAQKVLMIDRVRYLAKEYIKDHGITLEDKENLQEMFKAYKALGGNGHLDAVMAEVEHLPIIVK